MYEYLSGLIRVLEKRILDKTDLERMIGAKDAKGAFQVLNNTDYADNLLNLRPEEFEKALQRDMQDLKSLFFGTIENKNLLKLLFMHFDFHNIKYLLKVKYNKALKQKEEMLSKFGIVKPRQLKKLIFKKQKKKPWLSEEIDKDLAQSLKNISKKLKNKKEINPADLDLFTDLELFRLKKVITRRLKDKFLEKLTHLQIDLANFKALLRQRLSSKKRAKQALKKYFIQGGNLNQRALLRLYQQEEKELFGNLSEYLEEYQLREIMVEYQKTKALWTIEKTLYNLQTEFIQREARAYSAGTPIILSYYYQKMDAIRKIRMIMNAKLNNIPQEEMRKYL